MTAAFVADRRQGDGRLTLPDGMVYEGAWTEGRIEGQGRLLQPSGDVYEGAFVNGQRDGEGRVLYGNGDSYEGHFSADRRNGRGTFRQADGYSYEGDWKDGRREGRGTARYPGCLGPLRSFPSESTGRKTSFASALSRRGICLQEGGRIETCKPVQLHAAALSDADLLLPELDRLSAGNVPRLDAARALTAPACRKCFQSARISPSALHSPQAIPSRSPAS